MFATKPSILACIAAIAVTVPTPVFAAPAMTYDEFLLVLISFSVVVLLIWSVYFYFTPTHRHFMRWNFRYKRALLPIVGLVGIVFGATAAITGEAYLPGGSVISRALEGALFWRYVALQLGGGVLLIVVGLLYPSRRS